MFGRFQEWGRTNSDGPKLKIAGKWLFPDRRCNLDGLNPGMDVEYEIHMGGRDGKLPILDRIRPAPRSNGAGSPQTGSTITDGDILRSVSNVVGNACAAGKIADPVDVLQWVNAAYSAFTTMGKAQAPTGGSGSGPGPAPGEDEPPPFTDDEIPW